MHLDVSTMSVREIFTIAIRLEEDGIEFYKAASEKAHSKRLRDVLDTLIVQEVEHRMIFQTMASQYDVNFTPDRHCMEISPQVMQALNEAEVFPAEEERDSAIASLHSPAQVLRFAIRVEKGSAHFYKLAARSSPSEKIRDTFRKILAEEQRHIRLLTAELKVLKAGFAL